MSGTGPVGDSVPGPVATEAAAQRRRVVDLGIAVDRAAAAPLPDQLEHLLHALIVRGELAPGDVLPSSRALAGALEVSRGVVVEAYDRLLRHGLLASRPGGVVRVSVDLPPADGVVSPAEPPPTPPAEPAGAAQLRTDLHPAATPIGTLDRRAWAAAHRTALRDASEAELGSLDPAGLPGLRGALAAQLGRSRGVVTTSEQLVITSGVTDALHGLAPLLAARGGRVAVEDPGFGLHRATLIGAGLTLVPIPTDQDGLDIDALAQADVCAALITPAHQMPLGVPLAPERRARLVAWARERGTWLLEDDYDGELRYDRRGVRSLHGLAPDRVLYLGTTSKVL
ncbi:MAG: PLP-dependent aminotransferase family protein, partial [Solirubrobacteraceae bacterium]|nr:PLP-dependent aminotransferase family protein [Solirubrobacteraceae bacterium]